MSKNYFELLETEFLSESSRASGKFWVEPLHDINFNFKGFKTKCGYFVNYKYSQDVKREILNVLRNKGKSKVYFFIQFQTDYLTEQEEKNYCPYTPNYLDWARRSNKNPRVLYEIHAHNDIEFDYWIEKDKKND